MHGLAHCRMDRVGCRGCGCSEVPQCPTSGCILSECLSDRCWWWRGGAFGDVTLRAPQPRESRLFPQDHPNLSVIYGGSHAGSLSGTHRRLAFVALENCEGQDLFDLAAAMHQRGFPPQQLPKGLFIQA